MTSPQVEPTISVAATEIEMVATELPPPTGGQVPTSMPQAAVIAGPRTVRSDPPPAVTVAVTAAHRIPDVALAAYQRAATVLAAADPHCNLRWELLAAIGRVESDHGRHRDSRLDENGVARPAIHGIPLNGKRGTRAIPDTDAGHLDRDERWDRAVGPMQFIPTTWSVLGVDGDGDGVRNPQDIDDAALAAAVLLCAAPGDVSTKQGLRDAVMRYNQDRAYVRLVTALAAAYATHDSAVVRLVELGIGTVLPRKHATTDTPRGTKATAAAAEQEAASDPKRVTEARVEKQPAEKGDSGQGAAAGTDKGTAKATTKGKGKDADGGAATNDQGDRPAPQEPATPTPSEDAPPEPTPAEDTPAEDAPPEPTPAEDTPAEPTPADDAAEDPGTTSDACTEQSEEPTVDPTVDATTSPTTEPADDPTTQPTAPCHGRNHH